jgi:hypothetical protein
MLECFTKTCQENSSSLKIGQKKPGKLNEGLRIFMTTLVTIVTMVLIDSNL